MPERLKIVLGDAGSLARYPQGGGHWAVFVQYLAGFAELGHDVMLLEVVDAPAESDNANIDAFFHNVASIDMLGRVALLTYAESDWPPDLEQCTVRGMSEPELRAWIADADLLLNVAGWIRPPLLGRFRRKALLDLDPGHLQLTVP